MIEIKRTNGADPDFVKLTKLLDEELSIIYQTNSEDYAQYNHLIDLQTVVIIYEQEKAIACGCFRNHDPETVELKRMFVMPEMRGKGIASRILKEMEKWAAESGNVAAILETGTLQPAAIALYKKSGYFRITNYDQYAGVEMSVCMRKELNE